MPYDPMTGQNLPYSSSYSSQGMQTPLTMDVMNSYPSMAAMAFVGQRRGANTIMRGGFLDRESKLSRLNPITRDNRQAFGFKRNDALRRFRGSQLTDITPGGRFTRGSYAGPLGVRKQKAARMMASMAGEVDDAAPSFFKKLNPASRYSRTMRGLEQTNKVKASAPFLRPSIANNLNFRSRFHSVSIFGAAEGRGLYSPFQGANAIGSMLQNNQKFLNLFGITKDNIDAAGGQAASGGILSTIRAAGQMDALEGKIAKRTAAGKDVSGLTRKLEKAQLNVSRIGSITNPGVDIFNTTDTTLGNLQKEQIARRTTPGRGAKGGRLDIGRSTASKLKYTPVSGQNYFTSINDPIDAATGARTRAASGSNVSITREKTARGTYKYNATLGDKTRQIDAKVGASFFQQEVGYTGNLLASNVGGAVNQSIMGYMRGAQGFAYSGGLTGLAKEKAMKASLDLGKVVGSLDDATQASIRSKVGARSVDDITGQFLKPGRTAGPTQGFAVTVDDILQAQKEVADAGGKAGRKLTVDSFDVNKATKKEIKAKTFNPKLAGASAQDMVFLSQEGALGRNFVGQNTSMVGGTSKKVALTTDVSEHLARREAAQVAQRELYEGILGPGGKGLVRSFGIKESARLASKDAGFRKIATSRAFPAAMRFANPIMTASAIYDITKMAATAVIGGGARLARDAVKSMQGSINKPGFGMGFVDNEVAATSRARGVMAIQNSRLNARSTLGAEASMMAAHFG